MFRISLTAGIISLASFLCVQTAQAQSVGEWTLNINNRHGAAIIPAGGTLPYDLRITNDGNYDTVAGKLDLTIPATTIYRGVTGLDNCTPAPDGQVLAAPLVVSCDVPVLTPGQDLPAEVLLSPMQGECGGGNCVIKLEGRVSDPNGAPGSGTTAERSTTITVGADLELDISTAQTTVTAGSSVALKANVTNNGPYPSTSSQVVIPLPSGMTIAQLPGDCSLSGGNIICVVPQTLAVGESHEFDLSAQVTAGDISTISIPGRVEGGAPQDPVSANDNDTITLNVTPGTDVRLQKTRTPGGLLLIGDPVTFTLTPAFSGIEPEQATIVDVIPDNYGIVDTHVPAGSGWSCDLSGRTLTCDYAKAAGSVYASPITISATADVATDASGVVNTANISSLDENPDAPRDNNQAQDLKADIRAPIVDLKAHKSGPPRGLVAVGNSYDFVLRAENRGNKPFTDEMTITDLLPAGLLVTNVNAPSGWVCNPSSGPIQGPASISCTTNRYTTSGLAIGGFTDPITITAEVQQVGTISNGMVVSFPDYESIDDHLPDNTTYAGVTSADDKNWADIGTVKSVSPHTVQAGGEVTFVIEVYNEGVAEATNVEITDRLNDIVGAAGGGQPVDVVPAISTGVASGLTCRSNPAGDFGRNLECSIASLPVCVQGVDCPTISVTVRPGSQGLKSNTVNAYSVDVPDPDLGNNEDQVSYTVTPLTDVTVSKISPASASGAFAGQEIRYTVTASVDRSGLSHAENVVVTDRLPEGVIFVSAKAEGATCTNVPARGTLIGAANREITCAFGTINNGSQKALDIVVVPTTALVGATIINEASVATDTDETDPGNNSTQLGIDILPPSLDLIIDKTDNPYDPVEITTPVTYTISLENAGPSDAFGIVIEDQLPSDGFTDPRLVDVPAGLACTLSGTSTTAPGGQIHCTRERLEAGETVSFKLQMTSFKHGRWENTVSVSSDETKAGYEGPAANNVSQETTTVRTRADISVVKTPSVTAVDLRKEFYWDLVITNIAGPGLDIAEEVTLSDTLPAGMELTRVPEIIPAGAGLCTGVVTGRQIDCTFGDIPSGDEITVRLYTKITDLDAQAASNTATVDTQSFDKVPGNNTSTGSVTTVRGSSVSGKVYKDLNNDGTLNQTDSGIAGAQVTITGKASHDGTDVNLTIPTKSDGTYIFPDLPPGSYQVSYTVSNLTDYSSAPGDGGAFPGSNPAGEGTATNTGKSVITNIVTTGEYAHVDNDFTLVPLPQIGLGKTVGAAQFQADGSYQLAYTIKVRNHSEEPLEGIDLTDVMNDAAQLFGTAVAANATLSPGQYKVLNVAGSGIGVNAGFDGSATPQIVTGGTLAAGQTAEMTFTVQVQPQVPWVGTSTTHVNQAEVTATGTYSRKPASDASHNTATGQDNPKSDTPTTVTVAPAPGIELTKAATPERTLGAAEPNDRINYSFTIRNSGNIPLVDIVLSDTLPGLQALSPTNIARLEPGETYNGEISAYYLLTQDDLDRGKVDNTATVVGQWGTAGGTPQTVSKDATASVPSLSTPGIELVKDIAANNIQNPRTAVGDIVRYSFTVTNTGNTNLKNVTVADLLSGITPESSFVIGDMEPDEVVVIYATYAVTQADIDTGLIENTATATGSYGSTNTPISSDPSDRDVETFRQPGLSLVKELIGSEPVDPRAGDILRWRVVATNTGNVTLSNVSVADPLEGATVSPALVASLLPGANVEFTVSAPILQSWINAGQVPNIATASFSDPTGPQPTVPSNQVTVPLQSVPSIALKKIASLDALSTPPVQGDVISYTFTIRNTGNIALNNLTLVDELNVSDDEIIVALNATDMAALSAATLQPLEEFAVRGTYVLTQADVDDGSISNMARTTGTPVSGPNTPVEDASGSDFDTDDPTVNALGRAPAIALVKSIATQPDSPVQAGDVITYAFTIENTGNITLENIRIEDLVTDVQVTNVTGWTGPLGPTETNSDAFTATYVLKQSDIDNGEFANTAQVIGSSIGGTVDDVRDVSGTDTTNDTPTPFPIDLDKGISIVKSADDSALQTPPQAGDEISYSFVITNIGNVTLTDVVLTDTLAGIVLPQTTIPLLLPGESNAVTLEGTYTITQNDIVAGEVINQASVNGIYTDPSTGTPENVPDISDRITVPLVQLPSIAVIKEQDAANTTLSDPAEAGQLIAYTFTVKNTGNLVLTNVRLNDPLPGLSPNVFPEISVLVPGQQHVFQAVYAITEDDIDNEQVENQAIVTARYDDGSGPKDIEDKSGPTFDDDIPLIVPVIPPAPELTIVKTGTWNDTNGNGYPEPGETIAYTFDITNDGNATLYNVTPRDDGPVFRGQPASNTLSAFSPAPVTLAPNESQRFTATYTLAQDDIDAASGIMDAVVNTAVAVGNLRNLRPYETAPVDAVVTLPATEPSDVRITKQALLHQVRRGERVPYVIKVENTSSSNAGPVNILDTMPSGFRFIEGSATLDGAPFVPDVSARQVHFTNLSLGPNSVLEIRLDLLVLSSAGPGTHVNVASIFDRAGTRLAPDAKAAVEIVAEPIFDCGEVIGTVFDDRNFDGYQNQGEPGLPGVRVATVKGWLITTDKHGRFHVPCAALPDQRIGSNFIMKLDERTLPTGYRLTTENPRVVRLTAGKMTKINFGASVGRVVRLDLQGEAFKPQSTELQKQWQDNLDQLIDVLKQEPSVLRLNFVAPAAEQELAKKRVKALRNQIADLWKRKGASYPLEIETTVKAGN